MSRLKNKIAVVTGASKGIGAGIAKAFAAEGATVVVNYSSSKEGADKVVADIASKGGQAVALGANLSNPDEVTAFFNEVKKRYGHVDILVNNAGIASFSPVDATTAEEFDRVFNTNVRGVLLAVSAASPLFPSTGGSIINISSEVSTGAPAMLGIYAGTKGAIDVITKSHAKELGPRQIRVNAIRPGLIATEGTTALGVIGSDMEKAILAQTPLGRIGQPEDVGLPAVFLASDDARHITGETLLVSGGAGM